MSDWEKADIKAALEKRGITLRAIAQAYRLDPSSLSQALRNYRPMPRVKVLIARALGRRPQEIWPSLFDERGMPRRRNSTTSGAADNVSRPIHRAVNGARRA